MSGGRRSSSGLSLLYSLFGKLIRMTGFAPKALKPCQHSPGILSRVMLSSPIMNSLTVPFVREFFRSS